MFFENLMHYYSDIEKHLEHFHLAQLANSSYKIKFSMKNNIMDMQQVKLDMINTHVIFS